MSRAQRIIEMMDNLKKTAKISGIKDVELAKSFGLDMGNIFDIGADGSSTSVVMKDGEGLEVQATIDDIASAFEFEYVEENPGDI